MTSGSSLPSPSSALSATAARAAAVPPRTVDADVAVVGGGTHALDAVRALAGGRPTVALVTDVAPTAGMTRPVSALLAEAAATGQGWSAAYERARAAIRSSQRPVRVPAATLVDAGVPGTLPRVTGVRRGRALIGVPGGEGRPDVIVRARRVLLAAPTTPLVPGIVGLPDVASWRVEQVPFWEELPFSLVVLGGGATGCELAGAFTTWGSRVTVVERAERLLPAEHPAAGAAVRRELEESGVRVLLGGTVTRVAPTLDQGVYVGTDVGGDVAATHLVLATGEVPVAVPGADLLEADAGQPRWRGRRPELLVPDDDVRPMVLATRPQVARVGLACSAGRSSRADEEDRPPEGAALREVEVAVPGVDGHLVLLGRDDGLRGCTVVGDGAAQVVAEPALVLAEGTPMSRWTAVARASGAWNDAMGRALRAWGDSA